MRDMMKNGLIIIMILSTCVVMSVRADDAGMNVSREIVAAEALANVPGYKLTAVTVDIAPGVASPSHRHAGFVFVYVLEGTVESQLNSGDIVTYKVGESWVEPPGTLHSHAKNPSETEVAKILAVFIAKEDAQLTTIEKTH